jgi:hypothetical protein
MRAWSATSSRTAAASDVGDECFPVDHAVLEEGDHLASTGSWLGSPPRRLMDRSRRTRPVAPLVALRASRHPWAQRPLSRSVPGTPADRGQNDPHFCKGCKPPRRRAVAAPPRQGGARRTRSAKVLASVEIAAAPDRLVRAAGASSLPSRGWKRARRRERAVPLRKRVQTGARARPHRSAAVAPDWLLRVLRGAGTADQSIRCAAPAAAKDPLTCVKGGHGAPTKPHNQALDEGGGGASHPPRGVALAVS